jgi:hypothetical protein
MSSKFAEYASNACLGYALVCLGSVIVGYLVPILVADSAAGKDPNLLPVVFAAIVMLVLTALGSWFAVMSCSRGS